MAIPRNKLKDVAFSSEMGYLRDDYVKGSVNYFISNFGTVTIPIVHNLGYQPYALLWIKFPASPNFYSCVTGTLLGDYSGLTYEVYNIASSNTSIQVSVQDQMGGGSGSATLYYKLYRQH